MTSAEQYVTYTWKIKQCDNKVKSASKIIWNLKKIIRGKWNVEHDEQVKKKQVVSFAYEYHF